MSPDIWVPPALWAIYLAGWGYAARRMATNAVTRENVRRAQAIREAAFAALFWPAVLVTIPIVLVLKWVFGSVPLSERESAEELAALERSAGIEPMNQESPRRTVQTRFGPAWVRESDDAVIFPGRPGHYAAGHCGPYLTCTVCDH